MQVVVERKNVYGTERFYPVCEKAQIFARLSHRKTLDRRELHMIKDLGYEIVILQEEVAV